ncbi:MAG TPA: ABC transporter ATP-binding protein [Phycisphaerales bacterium]|nr:ABC transporter ATP-binding protein [Phycisphaerales bacterium]
MLEIANLTAQAGGFRLTDIQLGIAAGECHAVLGPSGSGKSTLLGAVLGTRPVMAGRVRLANDDITHWPIEHRRLGYVPQQLGLFPHLSVADNLAYSARARRVPEAEYRPLLDRLVDITGLGALLSRPIATLSGGERQRVALVRALTADPRLVLLDEPFTALNESLRREMWWLVKDLQRERGLTVMLVTHDLTEAYFLAEHITVLIEGRQEQSGSKVEVYRRPASLAVAHFLGLKNLFPATVARSAEGWIEADCPVLNARFRLPGDAPEGCAVVLGIRREDVTLRDAAHPPPPPSEQVLTGTVQIVDLGSEAEIHLQPGPDAPVIEVAVPWRTVQHFGLRDGQSGVRVGLPEAHMFWVKAP